MDKCSINLVISERAKPENSSNWGRRRTLWLMWLSLAKGWNALPVKEMQCKLVMPEASWTPKKQDHKEQSMRILYLSQSKKQLQFDQLTAVLSWDIWSHPLLCSFRASVTHFNWCQQNMKHQCALGGDFLSCTHFWWATYLKCAIYIEPCSWISYSKRPAANADTQKLCGGS